MSRSPAPVALSCPRPPLIHWQAVSVAASAGIVLVAAVFAWIATHPAHKERGFPVVLAAHPAAEEDLPVAMTPPAPQPVLQLVAHPTPAAPRPQPEPPEEPPPPRPAPVPPQAPPRLEPPAPPVRHPTQTYGTQVNFLGIPQEAANQARRENKLLFVLHVSGNFEESCFT